MPSINFNLKRSASCDLCWVVLLITMLNSVAFADNAITYNALTNNAVTRNAFTKNKANSTPAVQLAEVYNDETVEDYWISEKYDGIRAIWKNRELRTRRGNLIHAPDWFTEALPDVWLDGELWVQRAGFEIAAATVRKARPIDEEWRQLTYMVFDAPHPQQPFALRINRYTQLLHDLNIPHVLPVKQFRVKTLPELNTLLDEYTQAGAEGLMLHKSDAIFASGRTGNLLKLKQYLDAEAIVVAHLSGKGKYSGAMGSMLVEFTHPNGQTVRFKIGSGFSDKQRYSPPLIGTTITFSYHGFTQRGVPKFASFLKQK